MIKIYFLMSSMIVEFITIIFQLVWIRRENQILEAIELGGKTTEALFERGVLGITSIIFLITTGLLAYTVFKLIKEHKNEAMEQSVKHEENIKEIIKSHRVDSKEVALVFSASIDQSHAIIMKHAQNEAIQTELMRGIKDELRK